MTDRHVRAFLHQIDHLIGQRNVDFDTAVAGQKFRDQRQQLPLTLARHMPDKAALWREIAERHQLVQPDLAKLVGWGFGDFIFHTESDVISDLNKIYRYGFTERVGSKASLFAALDSLKQQRVIPWVAVSQRRSDGACPPTIIKATFMKTAGTAMKTEAKDDQQSASATALIDAKITELNDWRGETLARVRALVRKADPEVIEEVKWRGVPVWSHGGIICTGETYKQVVKMTFAKGAALDDPTGLFNSSLEGNTRRAIDIHEGEDIDEQALLALVRAAIALNTSRRRG